MHALAVYLSAHKPQGLLINKWVRFTGCSAPPDVDLTCQLEQNILCRRIEIFKLVTPFNILGGADELVKYLEEGHPENDSHPEPHISMQCQHIGCLTNLVLHPGTGEKKVSTAILCNRGSGYHTATCD
jgi:hypothetical protein